MVQDETSGDVCLGVYQAMLVDEYPVSTCVYGNGCESRFKIWHRTVQILYKDRQEGRLSCVASTVSARGRTSSV